MDTLKSLGELSMGSRLKRLSEMCMKTIRKAYQHFDVDFDPYLFPAFHRIANAKTTTNTALCEALQTSQPAVTQTVNKLLQKKLIELDTDTIDKRKKIISLSSEGREFHQKVQPLWRAMDLAVKQYTRQPANSLVAHIDQFEAVIKSGKFLQTIIEIMELDTKVNIINFEAQYARVFYDLNVEWLETFFYVEDLDREVLSNPHKYILDPGGHIFFAVENGEAVGTVALMKAGEGSFELTKMAVRPDQRGKKIGQHLMQHCIDFAREHDFKKLFLYSNKKLENAIYIYRKYGFVEIQVEPDVPYVRSDIKMDFPL